MQVAVCRPFKLLVAVVLAGLPSALTGQSQTAQPVQNPARTGAQAPDYSAQNAVFEQIRTDVAFQTDGRYRQETVVRVRVQSAAAVQTLGVVRVPYQGANDRVELMQVRVLKRDGAEVVTPETNIQDVAAEAARLAPTYSDAREKQAPVKGLSVGDTMEYRVVISRVRQEAEGHFWYAYDFVKSDVVLDETLRISVPAGRYVNVSSPNLQPEKREEAGRVIYSWKTANLEVPKADHDEPEPEPERRPRSAVQLTTFRNWEEVGRWYGSLQKSKLELSPALRAKAAELTQGLASEADKVRAIYEFVATKFRYISISLGEGRYQPHAADETLANQYGDCKDKHTLFAALLNVAGVEAWAALVNGEIQFDESVPSPGQFNHVITYLPKGGPISWLDTTPEVAAYGYLVQIIRDQKALIVPADGTPRLVNIPAELPYSADEAVTMDAQLSADGTLTGRAEIVLRGDSELIFRSAFNSTPPSRWRELAQNLGEAMGYGGTVSDLDAANPSKLDAPFRYSYQYEKKSYGDWPTRRITPPLPPLFLHSTDEKFKPKEPVYLAAIGKQAYRATIQLPREYSVEIPPNVSLQSPVADYKATYSVEAGKLTAERILTLKVSRLAPAQWDEFVKLGKGMEADQGRWIQLVLSASGAKTRVVRDVPEAAEYVQKAGQALQSRDFASARDALSQAERLNPEQQGLWTVRALLYSVQAQNEKALEAMEKEIEYHPGNEISYTLLASMQRALGRRDEALNTLRQWVKIAPRSADAASALASALIDSKKYGEAVSPLRSALENDPENMKLQIQLMEALLRDGKKEEGVVGVQKLDRKKLDAQNLNSIAWALADTNTEPKLARDLSAQAVTMYEEQLKAVTLDSLSSEHLDAVDSLGATWDTLGWAHFQAGAPEAAEKYVYAAWVLLGNAMAGDHLGQIYERQGRKAEAIRAYQVALAANSDMTGTKERLASLGGAEERPKLSRGIQAKPQVSAEQELSELRTTRLPELRLQPGSAEFFLLFSSKGVEEVKFVRGDPQFKSAVPALRAAKYNVPIPDQGPEKIPRRAILSCSAVTTPACLVVLLLPANTTLN